MTDTPRVGDILDRLECERDVRASIRALIANGWTAQDAAGGMRVTYAELYWQWQDRKHAGNVQHYSARYLRADRIWRRLNRLDHATGRAR